MRCWNLGVVDTDVWSGFFFQAEDGIRDYDVTGVQTCALPISISIEIASGADGSTQIVIGSDSTRDEAADLIAHEIGRASCRERV